MPYGYHIARCFCCGKQWVCGDCIPTVCSECEAKGHTGGFDCLQCVVERERRAAERRERRQVKDAKET